MSSEERTKLVEEANELGLEFPANIPTKKLQAMVAEAKGEPPPIDEEVPPSPEVKKEEEISDQSVEEETSTVVESRPTKAMDAISRRRELIRKSKEEAFKKRVVTLTNKDPRENEYMTTAYLSFENQYFGLSKLVPLDVPVELEQALIHIAETTLMSLHKDEIVDGKRTGNKVTTRVKKYAISYGQQSVE